MRINQKKYAVYLRKHGQEIFLAEEKTYDITKAAYLIEQDGRDSEEVSVDVLASTCGFDHCPIEERDGCSIFLCPDGTKTVIDREYFQQELDLEKPLLIANGKLIDGHHRLYRAFMFGRESMQAFYLTNEEIRNC